MYTRPGITKLTKIIMDWAGFKLVNHSSRLSDAVALDAKEAYYVYPDGTTHQRLPVLTKDLNSCFKLLRPILVTKLSLDDYTYFLKEWVEEFTLHNEDPALTFCKCVRDWFLLERGSHD